MHNFGGGSRLENIHTPTYTNIYIYIYIYIERERERERVFDFKYLRCDIFDIKKIYAL